MGKRQVYYCSLSCRAFSRRSFAAAAFAMSTPVGMVTVPEAAVRLSPPATVKADEVMGSRRKIGEGAPLVVEMRRDAMAKTNKPCKKRMSLSYDVLEPRPS